MAPESKCDQGSRLLAQCALGVEIEITGFMQAVQLRVSGLGHSISFKYTKCIRVPTVFRGL